MSHSWLQRKRKGELIDLAQKARLPDADGLLKDDLVLVLEDHLNSNESTFAKHPEFRDYYGRLSSPVKRSSPTEIVEIPRSTRRRTLIKDPSPEPEPTPRISTVTARTPNSIAERIPSSTARIPSSAARIPSSIARTPSSTITKTPRDVAERVSQRVSDVLPNFDIPASPAQLAEVADQSFQVAAARATELWDRTRIDQIKELVRENASSVATIQTLILLIEAAGLQWNTLDTTALFATPAILTPYSQSQDIRGPNAWPLLTADWWAPATLWSLTSWVLPLFFSYFFNLTLRSNTSRNSEERTYPADPLIFNIARAVLAYSAYSATINLAAPPNAWGPFPEYAVARVGDNVPGGYYGMQIGSLVGILVSLYDAALKK